ncbi:YwpF family protein [Bacillus dakarensis]|uniref:YwpF family protein n=1 Tax=Robertmurraya dakarensis TaxID=1926278 RepID=UPI0009817191|nr:YwpF family protein [Bacillus dakarensis]
MKTFKLVSLKVVKEDGLMDVPLEDGIMISKEDEENSWLIESYIDKSFQRFFQEAYDQKKELLIQTIISKLDNDPVLFRVHTRSVISFEKHISILLQGTLKKMRSSYAENLLSSLISKGLSGENLLIEFKDKFYNRPKSNSKV